MNKNESVVFVWPFVGVVVRWCGAFSLSLSLVFFRFFQKKNPNFWPSKIWHEDDLDFWHQNEE